ncbi:TDT family transporter [Clostridium baratii]|uniref:TDT family transporter n=1 Tax=Clostridium baratii TaxID=1561 RepID=UPI0006BB3A3C|nr:TDT family transporter [Clostridium baratii]
MEKRNLLKIRLEEYPIAFIGTCLGAITLTNLYDNFEFTAVRSIFAFIGCVALLFLIRKAIRHPKVVWEEMNNTILMALYPTSTMLLMNLGNYFLKFNYTLGKTLWSIGLIINVIFVIFFLIRHVIIGFNMKYVLPCWYALLVGVSVSCTTSVQMNETALVKPIFYFVVIAFLTFLPIVIYRLCTLEVPDAQYPLIAIFAAPASLCTISYITLYKNANIYIVMFFFILTLLTTLYVYINFPKFFSLKFNPTFAALTFPLAVSTAASFKVKAYLLGLGYTNAARIVTEISGIEFFIATAVVGFVFYNFIFNHIFNIKIRKFTK